MVEDERERFDGRVDRGESSQKILTRLGRQADVELFSGASDEEGQAETRFCTSRASFTLSTWSVFSLYYYLIPSVLIR